MTEYAYEILDSTSALRSVAAEWDDLWQRSQSLLPTGRAQLIADWVQQFAPRARMRAIVVRQGASLVAALPLLAVGPKVLRFGRVPGNAWSTAGELLVDPTADGPAACDQIVAGLRKIRLPVVWFDGASTETPAWRQLFAALTRGGMPTIVRERFRVEQVEIGASWENYFDSRSRNHRRHIRRARAKADQAGMLQLRVLDHLAPAEVEAWLRCGLEIEDRGWKGATGSSVLRSPGVFDYYLRQAQQLADWGQLQLVFLELAGQPIAFEYGWVSKGCYFSPKVAYDEAFGQVSPGQLLRAVLLARLHADGSCHLVDYLGPSSRATAEWSTRSYAVSRVLVATRPSGRAALAAYRLARPILQRLRRQTTPVEALEAQPNGSAKKATVAPSVEPVGI